MLKTYLIKGATLALVLLLLVWGRVLYLQHDHYGKAEQYFAESNWKLAMREYDLAMHMYTPWSPYTEKSARRLWQLGEMYEKEGRPDWALIAYGSIRSSFYASRGLYTPGKGWIKRCNGKIASLNVKILLEEGTIMESGAESEREGFLHVLEADAAPNVFWSVLAGAGFMGWTGSVLFIIFKGFGSDGRVRRRQALYGVLSFALSFAVWALALLKA